jgi:glyceraldehyde 3-phosphate dehydrogenase
MDQNARTASGICAAPRRGAQHRADDYRGRQAVALVIPETGQIRRLCRARPDSHGRWSISWCSSIAARRSGAINHAFARPPSEISGHPGRQRRPLVSSDFIGMEYSSMVDLPLTMGMGDNFFRSSRGTTMSGAARCASPTTALIADGFAA